MVNMYYSKTIFREYANEKLEQNEISGGEIRDDELRELYKAWMLSPHTSFKDFFNSFCFMTPDEIEDMFDVDWRMHDEFDFDEILEYLLKEEREMSGALRLSEDLVLVIG